MHARRSLMAQLFDSRSLRKRSRARRPERRSLQSERLEARQLLAIDLFQYPVAGVTSGDSSYAVLLMSDGVNGFLKKNSTPSPSFTYADNSQFLDNPATLEPESITFFELPGNFGPLNSFYVTSGVRQTYTGAPLPASFLGKTTTILNTGTAPDLIDVGTSDGIVPGTFLATVSIVDNGGKGVSAGLLASKPGNTWNLSIERLGGDGELPNEGRIDESTGDVILRGWSEPPQSVDLSPISWGVYTDAASDPNPLSFTLFAGQTVPQRMLVDLSRNESTITINSPLTASLGKADDPRFFSGASLVAGQVGQVVLDGSTIVTNADVSSSNLFTVGVPLWSNVVSTRIPVRDVTINRPLAAPRHQLLLEGTPASPGRLLVGEQGSLANSLTTPVTKASSSLDIQAKHADVVFGGVVNALQQTYLLQSPADPRAYSLTTASPLSGVQTGRILGDTLGITLANDAGGEFDVRTEIANLRLTAATTPAAPVLPYAIRVAEADDLVVDAVPASQRAIEIAAGGTLTLQSSIDTSGSLKLDSKNKLTLLSPISSATGSVSLVADSISTSSPVTAGGTRGVTLTSRSETGDVEVNALVRAGGAVKQPVRLATTADVALATAGLATIDGIALVAGDRVLVKNQTLARENGIYVASLGPWTRAADAGTSGQFTPGFSVFVAEGSQEGGWTFANPANPSLGTTGLLFVPASATQTYARVAAATTANVVLSGLQTVDDVVLAPDQRVLVKNQTNKALNGLYVVSAGPWQRASDADTAAELRAGSYVFVEAGGTANASKGFVLDDDAVQVGVTALNFSAFAVQATRTNVYSPANVLPSVVAATTVNIDLSLAPATIDGRALATGDRVLVKNQINAAENGVYAVQGSGLLARASGATSAANLARGTTVYVDGGAVNAATSWTFDDATGLLGSITSGTQTVTGLASTARLAIGMLVTGPGIPAGTTIAGITGDTSIRLSKVATATDRSAALRFMEVSAVGVGTTPIVFIPTGGGVVITSGRSVTSSGTPTSRLQGATALLSAGRPAAGTADPTSTIAANTNVGRLSAAAPATITIDNANEINLVGVGTSTAGPITVTAAGTLTASSVAATGTAGASGDVTLVSAFGNVVASDVTSTLGDIVLTASRGDVRLTKVGPYSANVTAQAGSVSLTANESPGFTSGDIRVDGRLVADGGDSDIVLKTSTGGLRFTKEAFVNAKDQLLIDTPEGQVAVDAGAQIAASRLSLTAQLGTSKSPPAGLGTYQTVFINRTDKGDIDYSSAGSLKVEGAITKDGSIAFTAPDLTVAGTILPNGATKEISLHATAGDLLVDAPLTAPGHIRTKAPAGKITSGTGSATPLITSPRSLFVEAATLADLTTKVANLDAVLTAPGAVLRAAEADGLVIDRVRLSAGGTADLKVGSPATGGSATVKLIDVGATAGTLTLVASENILEAGTPTVVDIVANRAELTATTGRIDVDTDVNVLLASATQKNQSITVDDLGADGLELQSVATNNADITVTSKGTILATSVATAGKIKLATSAAGSDILVGSIAATGNTVSLAAQRSILEATPADPAADITATTVALAASTGSIDVHVDASAVSATARAAGATIQVRDDNDLSIGDGTTGVQGNTVTFKLGGKLVQTQPVLASSLTVAPTVAGGDVSAALTGPNNRVSTVSMLGGKGDVSFTSAGGLFVAAVTGNAVGLQAAGNLWQSAGSSIQATKLEARATAPGAVVLTGTANKVGTLSGGTSSGSFKVVNAQGLTIGAPGIVAGTTKAGDGDIELTALTGGMVVAANLTAASDAIRLNAVNGTITQQTGAEKITAATLVWNDKTTPIAIAAVEDDAPLIVGTVPAGGSTNDATPTISGTTGANSSVTVFLDNKAIAPAVVADKLGKWSLTAPTLADGTYSITAQARNAAGRSGLFSTAYRITVNTIAPAAPVITAVVDNVAPITGNVANGGRTNDSTPTISGTAEPGSTVTLSLNGTAIAPTAVANAAGSWSITTAPLADDTYAITARVSNAIGNTSVDSGPYVITIDTAPPTAPVITAVVDNVAPITGNVANGGRTNDTTPTISGTAEPGSTVTVRFSGVAIAPKAVADGAGRWSVTAPARAAGTYAISAVATDAVGNTGVASAAHWITIDITPPAAPAITAVVDNVAPITGNVFSGGRTNDTTPTISGTAEPGSTVTVFLNGTAIAPTALTNGAGRWAVTTAPLAAGAYAITARAADVAGNTSTLSATYSITIDITAPTITAISAPSRTYQIGERVEITATLSEALRGGGRLVVGLDTGASVILTAVANTNRATGSYVVEVGQITSRLRATSVAVDAVNPLLDLAGNAAAVLLPGASANFGGAGVVIDGSLRALPSSPFSGDPNSIPNLGIAVTQIAVRFTAPVTGVTLSAFSLTLNGRPVSMRDAQVSGSGTDYTVTLPAGRTNPSGIYTLQVSADAGIRAVSNGTTMASPGLIYWGKDRSVSATVSSSRSVQAGLPTIGT